MMRVVQYGPRLAMLQIRSGCTSTYSASSDQFGGDAADPPARFAHGASYVIGRLWFKSKDEAATALTLPGACASPSGRPV